MADFWKSYNLRLFVEVANRKTQLLYTYIQQSEYMNV